MTLAAVDHHPLPPFLRYAVPGWLTARRFSVPPTVVERATARRLAGDWRGACAAARFEVQVDVDDVRNRFGADIAGRVEDDLRHLAPDLVRWHLPREHAGGLGRVLPDLPIMLARYGCDGPALWVHTQAHFERPPWPRLRFGPLNRFDRAVRGERWDDARYLWDARATDGLRHRLAGLAPGSRGVAVDRTPFHHRDGRRLAPGELPTGHPGPGDPAALVEWVTLLLDAERTDDAWAAAGIAAELHPDADESWFTTHQLLVERNPMVTSIAAELRHRLATDGPTPVGAGFTIGLFQSWTRVVVAHATPEAMTAALVPGSTVPDTEPLPRVTWQRSPDLELLRLGLLTPAGLHPLVRTALFPDEPGRAATDTGYRPDGRVAVPGAVKVRCGGAWHRVGWRAGRVDALDHPPEDAGRERTLRSLGGPMAACFRVTEAWADTGGPRGRSADEPDDGGRVPRRLRELRRDAAALIGHGDTEGFLDLLDAGLDVTGVRNRRHRTPLHLAAHLHGPDVDAAGLVRRLLDAGLDIDATDAVARTPLGTVLFDGGSAPLVRALLDAGADPRHIDSWGCSPLHLMRSVDAATILPWLLDAGLDLEGLDVYRRTPLKVQLTSLAPPETLRVMIAAGARRVFEEDDDPVDETFDDKVRRYRYDDLGFLLAGAEGGER